MNYVIQQNVPMCPNCSAMMRKCYGSNLYYRCNDCKSEFEMVDVGTAEIEVIITDGEEQV